jgi:dihydrofolate reductase
MQSSRKLVLEVQLSIDGFMASPDGGTGWMLWNWSPEWSWDEALQAYHTRLTQSADCILLSSQMAQEGFIAHWKSIAGQTGNPQQAFASHIVQTPKIVFSSRLTRATAIPGGWDNAEPENGDAVAAIRRLKKQPGGNILVYGGASFVSSLIENYLIDEFHLLINPVAIGKGLSIFGSLGLPYPLQPVNAIPFPSGMVVLHYRLKL